ncbi:protein O-linked-mannose beta-1,2-N-acetylglucosaminyltransferase 1 [Hyalella azteca]|uniref:Protein O-linked-mannose beta-1,2-N-acetylglucosaminyltransferase 1 n=1 Tax=Hyalella azteca TaxID=294128 RepID=A0A979FTQ7_HYAAZ|nr:protein O-linked-mannose beta-1,2-N-acetylglucosaminyltransferase 1 [Hyalella azteca]
MNHRPSFIEKDEDNLIEQQTYANIYDANADRFLRPVEPIEEKRLLERRDGVFEVQVLGAKDNLKVLVDDKLVYSAVGEASDGVHALALSGDGEVMLRRDFRTGQPAETELLGQTLTNLQPGALVVLVMMFTAGDFLRSTERMLLQHLGMRGDTVGGALKLGADLAQGIGSSPYLIDNAQLRQRARAEYAKRSKKPYEALVLTPDGREVKKKLQNGENLFLGYTGYVDTDDPSILISVVPENWPPQNAEEQFAARVYLETAVVFKSYKNQQSSIDVSVLIPKGRGTGCAWHRDPRRQKQAQFCRRYEGYGTLCRCKDPLDPQRLRRSSKNFIPMSEIIPIAMLTATRCHFFYRQLISLLLATGAAQTDILVLIDGHQEETAQLAAIFGLPVIEHRHEGDAGTSTPLNAHFRFSLFTAFSTFRNASKVIILEDDLIVSPDFISYFHQTAWLLDADATLYVVNSFSLNSCPTVAADATRVRRSQMFPQFGWMVTREYAQEILHFWVDNSDTSWDWDWRLHHPRLRRGRHALVPEVSRSFHSGSSGAHINGWSQALIFSNMIYNHDPDVKLKNLHLLQANVYADYFSSELRRAKVLSMANGFNPCLVETIPEELRPGPVIIHLEANSYNDLNSSLVLLAKCLHTYPDHAFDNYEGVVQYTITDITPHTTLYAVACPISPYCGIIKNATMTPHRPGAMEQVSRYDGAWRLARWYSNTREVRYSNHSAPYYGLA